jgi:hypothetical protein
MLFVSLAISLFLLLWVITTAFKTKKALSATFVAGGLVSLAPICLTFFSVAVVAHAAAVVVAVAIWETFGWRFRWLLLLLLVATTVSYGIIGGLAFNDLRRLQQKYPYESMEARVLSPRGVLDDGGSDARPTDENTFLESDLDYESHKTLEPYWGTRSRNRALQELHENAVEEFASSPGFGVARMRGGISDRMLKLGLRSDDDIAQPGVRTTTWMSAGYADQLDPVPPDHVDSDIWELHRKSAMDFVNIPGFGYFKDRRHVAGFQSHRFAEKPAPVTYWKLQTLDLVGMVVHDEPVAYISEHLPRMEELRQAPTRSLDPFEQKALIDLRRGKNLYVCTSPDGLRVLGALRCARQCADCHGAQQGDLLGAFSYSFTSSEK